MVPRGAVLRFDYEFIASANSFSRVDGRPYLRGGSRDHVRLCNSGDARGATALAGPWGSTGRRWITRSCLTESDRLGWTGRIGAEYRPAGITEEPGKATGAAVGINAVNGSCRGLNRARACRHRACGRPVARPDDGSRGARIPGNPGRSARRCFCPAGPSPQHTPCAPHAPPRTRARPPQPLAGTDSTRRFGRRFWQRSDRSCRPGGAASCTCNCPGATKAR